MINRGKQFKVLSPKKVSRRKRTPRCETCGKRDGEDAGNEGQGKIRLKLCARCRGVAYCGMECQKMGWKVHREVCVQYANAAELPPPSPLVNQKISGAGPRGRRKVIYGGAVGTVGATPRQRENAPTRHPFFGRQESSEREPRAAAGQHPATKTVPVRKQKEQDVQQRAPRRPQQQQQPQQQPRHEQLSNDEDGCPSPPVMQRLSFPGGNSSRTRQGSRPGSAGGGSKRSPSSSKSPPPTKQNRKGSRGSVAAAVKAAASRVRRSSHAAENGTQSRGSGGGGGGGGGGGPVRRESAPLYPVALEKSKRRAASLAPSSAVEASRRGPPPPYASVAHRAESIRQGSSPISVGTSASGGPSTTAGAVAGLETRVAEGVVAAAPPPPRPTSSAGGPPAARVPPPLPPRTAVALGGGAASSPRQGSPSDESSATQSPQHARENGDEKPIGGREPTAPKDKDADAPEKSAPLEKGPLAGQIKAWVEDGPQLSKPEKEDGKELTGLREEDTDEPTPERRVEGTQSQGVFDGSQAVDEPVLAKRSEEGFAAGSTPGRKGTAAVPVRPSLSKDSRDSFSQDSAAGSAWGQAGAAVPVRPSLSKDFRDSLSQDSAAGSTAGPAGVAVPVRPSLSKDFRDSLSQDSAAGSTAGQEGSTVRVRPSLGKNSTGSLSQDSAAASTTGREVGVFPVPPSLADSTNGFSHDSAAASTAGHEGRSDQTKPSLAKESADSFSYDSAAGSPVGQKELRLPMDPPPPILPPSATSKTSGLARASNDGLFDSCPPAAGGTAKPGSHRSLSVGTSPQFHSMPLVLAAKGIATAAAAAWNADRRTSPRPRPPVSPGPAALSDTSFRSRKQSAADPDDYMPKISPSAATAAAVAAFGREKMSPAALPPSRTPSARSLSTGSRRASPRSGMASPRSPPFVPAVELSPQGKLQTSPRVPGPRPTDTAVFYQERLGAPPAAAGAAGLPPPSRTYLGRPDGFSVHVLVASAPTHADLAPGMEGLAAAAAAGGGKDNGPRLYYSFEDRGRVAAALQPGDVVLVTPGRYEARAWGLQRLIASVEIVGAGVASDCVIYNDPAAPAAHSGDAAAKEHYLLGVMGGALGGAGEGGASVPAVGGKDDVEDDSDSGFEDGALGGAASSIGSFGGRAVRVRLANLTLEQGSGYRGAVYQLGRESHLEMEGCTVACSQGGVNIDQGTCAIFDSAISGSEAFGVHIGGEGAVEHCLIRDCGRGGRSASGGGRRGGDEAALPSSGADGAAAGAAEDDGTDVNRVEGMPAISFLQSSRVRVRFNVVRDNAGHSLQCRDAPLPGGDGKYAMLARRAEAEAEEKLRSWLGSAAVLLREHLQEQHREGSIVSEGNQCKLNRGCDRAGCAGTGRGRGGGGESATTPCPAAGGEAGGSGSGIAVSAAAAAAGEEGSPDGGSSREAGDGGAGTGMTCVPTAEEEGLPLPAAMTLRFLAAMDAGYIGSRQEENARLRRTRRGTTRDERAG